MPTSTKTPTRLAPRSPASPSTPWPGPSTGGASFGEDYPVHRSVMAMPRSAHQFGGVEVVAPSSLPFLPASGATPYYAAYLGGARYSATGLPLADLAPLKYSKETSLPKTVSSGSSEEEVDSLSPPTTRLGLAPLCVPEAPCFLEPNNHVFVVGGQENLGLVTHLMEQAFASCDVDYAFKPHKCKWKAARYNRVNAPHKPHKPPASVDFRARVYQHGEGGWVVEFQKRQGDYFLMREAFECFVAAAEAAGLVSSVCATHHHHRRASSEQSLECVGNNSNSSHTNSTSKHAAFVSSGLHHLGGSGSGVYVPPPASFGRAFTASSSSSSTTTTMSTAARGSSSSTTTTTTAFAATTTLLPPPVLASAKSLAPTITPLLHMAQGDCHKASREAVLCLAKLSASEDNRTVMKEAGAIPVLVALVKGSHEDGQVRQAAVTALSNLSESASCKPPLVEAGAVSGLLSLVGEGDGCPPVSSSCLYMELETRRESARTLANLSEDHAPLIVREVGKDGIQRFIKTVDGLVDERLRMHARRFKSRMTQAVC